MGGCCGSNENEKILYLSNKLGFRIAEVPVAWVDAPGSKVDITKYWYKVTCSPQVSFKDPNTNDSYTEIIPPPP